MPAFSRFSRSTRRELLASLAGLASAGIALPALSQSAFKPTRPVRIINPLRAGGATDAIVRPLARQQRPWEWLAPRVPL